MRKAVAVAVLTALLVGVGHAIPCPIMMVSGTRDANGITLTFRNVGKLLIRRLEFNCRPARGQASKNAHTPCREENALFYPGPEYTVKYPYPGGVRQALVVSVRSATLSNGYVWKPTKREPCHTLRIAPRRTSAAGGALSPERESGGLPPGEASPYAPG